jgi:excinuclease ABC subunit A
MMIEACPTCEGQRLNAYARGVKVKGIGIMDVTHMSIEDTYAFMQKVKFKGNKAIIAEKLLKEINSRLKFLVDVGLTYLTLNRGATTLSGGESQRIRLATQIGSALSGVLYVLDEPSIGLHQRDNDKLIKTLKHLKSLGNTVVVVEHDEDTMLAADHIIDIGPGAGIHGGQIVDSGTPAKILKSKSITGRFLSKKETIPSICTYEKSWVRDKRSESKVIASSKLSSCLLSTECAATVPARESKIVVARMDTKASLGEFWQSSQGPSGSPNIPGTQRLQALPWRP